MDQLPPPRPLHRPFAGSGGLAINGLAPEQGGSGLVTDETSERGFWARITARPGQANAYGYVRCDEGDPATFPQLLGVGLQQAPFYSTGQATNAPAYEVSGRTDVPSVGTVVVWLEPLQGGIPGYGFSYPGAAIRAGTQALAADTSVTSSASPTLLLTLTLPSEGVYLITGVVTGSIQSALGAGEYTALGASLRRGSSGGLISGTSVYLANLVVSGAFALDSAPISYLWNTATDGPRVDLVGYYVGFEPSGGGNFLSASSAAATNLSYVKVG